mgnify:CR=1 FL=1
MTSQPPLATALPPIKDGSALHGAARISRWLAWAGGAMLLVSAVLISLDVLFRAVFKVTVFESFELSGYAFAIATAMGMSYALASRAHIRIEVAYQNRAIRTRGWLDAFAFTVLALTALALLYWSAQMVLGNYESGARSNSSLSVPLAIPQALWLLGLAWFALLSCLYAFYGLRKCLTGQSDVAHQRLGMASLEDEIDANTARGEQQP